MKYIRDRYDAGHAQHFARVIPIRAWIDNNESAAAGVVLSYQRASWGWRIVALDDDMFEQIAETGFDGALVAAIDIHVVGHGALLTDVAVGLHQHHAGRVAEIRPARGKFLQRRQPRLDGGQFLFASAKLA